MNKNIIHQTSRICALAMIASACLITGISLSHAQDGTISAVGDDSLGNPIGQDPIPAQEPQVIDGANVPVEPVADPVVSAPPVSEDVAPVAEDFSTPPQDTLSAAPAEQEPAPVTQITPLPSETEQGVAEGGNVMNPDGQMQKHSGQYFDGTAVVPDAQLSKVPGASPRMVDPKYEPGSKYVVAYGTASAKSFEAQYVAATRAIKLQRYAAAMEMFEKLYRQNSKDERVLMGLAVAQQGAGFTESAAHTYEELLRVQPNNANAIVNLMGIMKNQYPSVTLTRLMELRQKYPNNPGIPAQIGLVNADLGNYDDSLRYFEIAASMEPSNPSHIYNMAIVADKQSKVKKAIQLYERALQMEASAIGTVTETLPREQIYDRLVVLRRKV